MRSIGIDLRLDTCIMVNHRINQVVPQYLRRRIGNSIWMLFGLHPELGDEVGALKESLTV